MIKKTLKTIDPFTFKSRLQNLHFNSQISHAKNLDVLIDENQLVAFTKRTILHKPFAICDYIDLSNVLNKPPAVTL